MEVVYQIYDKNDKIVDPNIFFWTEEGAQTYIKEKYAFTQNNYTVEVDISDNVPGHNLFNK